MKSSHHRALRRLEAAGYVGYEILRRNIQGSRLAVAADRRQRGHRDSIGLAIAGILLAGANALAQTSPTLPKPEGDYQLTESNGPVVGGRHIQPTQSDIIEREGLQRPGRPPGRGPDPRDKELDELYEQLLQQSRPQH